MAAAAQLEALGHHVVEDDPVYDEEVLIDFLGRCGDESALFRLAGQIERAAGWAGRLPTNA